MLPLRLRIAGFLSYREPQELEFDGVALWLLTGPNGSGKSAVFDAMAWALFGTHRGGGHPTVELIHHGLPRCDVEFDFRLPGGDYRIDRSLRRTPGGAAGSQALYQRECDGWHPLPESNRKAVFDDWIRERIGPETTFRATRLLRQNHAEQLLDASPRARAELLADLIGLDRCDRLHGRATQELQVHRAVLEGLDRQFAPGDWVDDGALDAATRAYATAESALEACRREIDDAQAALKEAHRQAACADSLHHARSALAESERCLANAETTERDYARGQELRTILPVAAAVRSLRTRLADSEHRSHRFQKQFEAARHLKEQFDGELAAGQRQRKEQLDALSKVETQAVDAARRLRQAAAESQSIQAREDRRRDVARLETQWKDYPADLDAQVAANRETITKLEALSRLFPLLERRLREQREAAELVALVKDQKARCERIRERGEAARAEHDAIAARLARAADSVAQADRARILAELQAAAAREALERLNALASSAACDACGQPLTEEHRHGERERRSAAIRAAEAHAVKVQAQWTERAETARALQAQTAEVQSRLLELREEYREDSHRLAALDRDAARGDRVLAELTAELSPALRDAGEENLRQLRLEVQRLDALRRRLQQLLQSQAERAALVQQWERLRAQFEMDPQSATDSPQKHLSALEAEEASFVQEIRLQKPAIEALDRDLEALARRSHDVLVELTDLAARLRAEEAVRAAARDEIEHRLSALPVEWQMRLETAQEADVAAWTAALDELDATGAAGAMTRLQAARHAIDDQRAEVSKLNAVNSRDELLNVDECETRFHRALAKVRIAEAESANRRVTLQQLETRRGEQARLNRSQSEAAREHARWQRLADLLGPEKLQRHWLRQAESAVVESANAVLRPSMQLSLVHAAEPKCALVLQAGFGGGSPIPVAFLSAGQRFRVALALAVAMGESPGTQFLCIDEVFAGLDTAARAELMRDLPALARRVGRLIVSSHEAATAEFGHAVHFELVDGATRVERV